MYNLLRRQLTFTFIIYAHSCSIKLAAAPVPIPDNNGYYNVAVASFHAERGVTHASHNRSSIRFIA